MIVRGQARPRNAARSLGLFFVDILALLTSSWTKDPIMRFYEKPLPDTDEIVMCQAVSYTHLTLPTNREV